VEFSILGPVEVCSDGVKVPGGGARERSLLAFLLLGEGRQVPAERMIDALWEEPPRTARAQLHNLISKLRTRKFGSLIVTHPMGYALRLGDHSLDLIEFRRSVQAGQRLISEGDKAQGAEVLAAGLSLWRGSALADVPGEFAEATRLTLAEERLFAVEERFGALIAIGAYFDVLRDLPPVLVDSPFRERLHELHMTALAASGRQADALAVYREFYRRIVDELGVEPGQALRMLEQRILRGEVDIAASRRIVIPRELPAVMGDLTGRDKLLEAISGELTGVAVLTGPGGIGKTAVAIAVAHAKAADFPNGQLYVNLRGSHAEQADAHVVVGRLLRSLGVDGSLVPHDREERVALYRSTVADLRLLVVLDDAHDEEQVRPLLPGGPGCATLITSRRQLGGLVGAARYSIPVLTHTDALELLTRILGGERIAADPDSAVGIVASCGYFPLATCIAATRLAVRPDWTLADFQRRLATERSRLDELAVGDLDVRASIRLSYEALEPLQQALFRRLGLISAPDWPLWVAEVLAEDPAVERLLDQLVDVHLVEPLGRDALGQERFRLHDLIADFARESAADAEDPRIQAGLLKAWLSLVVKADSRLLHGMSYGDIVTAPAEPPKRALPVVQERAREWLEIERESLVAAGKDACRLNQPGLVAGLALRMFGFFALGGYRDDQENMLRNALGHSRRGGLPELRLRILELLFTMCVVRDHNSELPELAAEHLALARQAGDPYHETVALTQSGLAARRLGRLSEAAQWNEKAAFSCNDDTAPRLHSSVLASAAVLHWEAGLPERALPFAQRMLAVQRPLDVPRTLAMRLLTHADVLIDLGRLDEAETSLREAKEIFDGVDDAAGSAYAQHRLADVAIGRDEWDVAAAGLRRSLEVFERLGDRNSVADVHRSDGDLALRRGRHSEALRRYEEAVAICRGLTAPLELARNLARQALALNLLSNPASETCRREYEAIIAEAGVDERCLRLPQHPLIGS